jgi:hypothetical protein
MTRSKPRLLTMTFTTAAFDRSSSWQFEASSYTATPEGHPPSLLQHDARASSWHNYIQASNEIGPLLDMTTTVTGLLCWRDSHPLERQLASLHGTCSPRLYGCPVCSSPCPSVHRARGGPMPPKGVGFPDPLSGTLNHGQRAGSLNLPHRTDDARATPRNARLRAHSRADALIGLLRVSCRKCSNCGPDAGCVGPSCVHPRS